MNITSMKRPPCFKVTVHIVDVFAKKRVARVVGYGTTLDILRDMERVRLMDINHGAYVGERSEMAFLRRGHKDADTNAYSWSFLDDPEMVDVNDVLED